MHMPKSTTEDEPYLKYVYAELSAVTPVDFSPMPLYDWLTAQSCVSRTLADSRKPTPRIYRQGMPADLADELAVRPACFVAHPKCFAKCERSSCENIGGTSGT